MVVVEEVMMKFGGVQAGGTDQLRVGVWWPCECLECRRKERSAVLCSHHPLLLLLLLAQLAASVVVDADVVVVDVFIVFSYTI